MRTEVRRLKYQYNLQLSNFLEIVLLFLVLVLGELLSLICCFSFGREVGKQPTGRDRCGAAETFPVDANFQTRGYTV